MSNFDGTLDLNDARAANPQAFDNGLPAQLCDRCTKPGASPNPYKGQHLHLSCKLEAKLDDGTLGDTPTQGERKARTPKRPVKKGKV
jgi:hypothetical protein